MTAAQIQQAFSPAESIQIKAARNVKHTQLNLCHDILAKAFIKTTKNIESRMDGSYTIGLIIVAFNPILAEQDVQLINSLIAGYAHAVYYPNTNTILIK